MIPFVCNIFVACLEEQIYKMQGLLQNFVVSAMSLQCFKKVHKNFRRYHCFDSWCLLVATNAAGDSRRTLGVPRMGIK